MHSIRLILLFTVVIFSYEQTSAQLSKKYKNYQQALYKGMRYGLFKPEDYSASKSYPLIVYLHGSGDTLSRDNSWYQGAIQKENPCFVLSPKTEVRDQGWGNSWREEHTPAMQKTLALMDSLINEYSIDKSRLYIYGISMGGFGVFSVLSKNPEKFAGAYAICGGSSVDVAASIKTPLWIFHGADDDIVPVRLSHDIYHEMVARGNSHVRYTEYPGVKHNSWENVSAEKTLHKWLLSQQKGKTMSSVPDRVRQFRVSPANGMAMLEWNESSGDNIWYYKVFRDNMLYAEIDGNATSFIDTATHNKPHVYYITAVTYHFMESSPSEKVPIK